MNKFFGLPLAERVANTSTARMQTTQCRASQQDRSRITHPIMRQPSSHNLEKHIRLRQQICLATVESVVRQNSFTTQTHPGLPILSCSDHCISRMWCTTGSHIPIENAKPTLMSPLSLLTRNNRLQLRLIF